MKVSTSSKKEPKRNLGKPSKKEKELRTKISELKKENRNLRKCCKLMKRSRDAWKLKNKKKADKIKNLKRKIAGGDKPKRHHYGLEMINLCTLLRILGGCSYRSIRRILEILQFCRILEMQRIPCANTVENWVSKLGLYQLKNVTKTKSSQEVCLIIDENLKPGNERVMLMLLTPSKKLKTGATTYEDIEVLFMGGEKSWTGEKIEQRIRDLIGETKLKITHILSDEDSKLKKATRLLDVPHLPDISHAIAKCLRKTFEKDEAYQAMIKLISGYAHKCVNRDLTYLRPPKQRVKARFMNQKPIICWALTILSRFDELNQKEQLFFKELIGHQAMLIRLKRCIDLSDQIIHPLKEEGLNEATMKNFKQRIKQVSKEYGEDKLIVCFVRHLEKYAEQYASFLENKKGCYNVSSDIIESLFGKQKMLMSSNPLTGLSLLDLELPVHCIGKDKISSLIKPALEKFFVTNLSEWRRVYSSGNQALIRKLFFGKRA